MPFLGDYLGQLMSEIAMARMQADLETIRLAELYASHPLLRTLPVPHVRLPNVDLDVPVLVTASEPPRPGESARGGPTTVDAAAKVNEAVSTHLANAGITLTPADRKKLSAALAEPLKSAGGPAELSVAVRPMADELASRAFRVVSERKPAAGAEETAAKPGLQVELAETVRLELLKARTPPPRLTVSVTSAEIREAGTPENLTRLRLKISEQGLEWAAVETEGVSSDRLVPE